VDQSPRSVEQAAANVDTQASEGVTPAERDSADTQDTPGKTRAVTSVLPEAPSRQELLLEEKVIDTFDLDALTPDDDEDTPAIRQTAEGNSVQNVVDVTTTPVKNPLQAPAKQDEMQEPDDAPLSGDAEGVTEAVLEEEVFGQLGRRRNAETLGEDPTLDVMEKLPTGRVVVITSGKGGVGKTTTTANIGTGLARLGYSVVMVDTDIGLRNLDILMGLENRIVYNLVDVVEGRCKLHQALVKDKRLPGLMLLPAAQTRDKSAITEEQMVDLCSQLKQLYDFVLLDCPAGIEQGFQNAIAAASEAIVVCTPEMSSVRDADRVVGLLEARDTVTQYRLVVNRVRPNLIEANDMMAIEDVLDILAINLLGVIPEDSDIIVSTNRGEPVVLDEASLSGQAYRNIARRVAGEDVPLLDLMTKEESWLQRLRNFFLGAKKA
jgi:septum site-determining protein MinD